MSAEVDLSALVAILERGGVVACPTETVYGLLSDATNSVAVARVAAIKGRAATERPPQNKSIASTPIQSTYFSADAKPIALLAPSIDAVSAVALSLGPVARALADQYWPGPLTLIVEARSELCALLVRNGTVGVRVPGASPALDLARAFGRCVTATSANRTGAPAAITADEVRMALGDDVDAIVPGEAPGGPQSTIVDATCDPPRILRQGAVFLSVGFRS